ATKTLVRAFRWFVVLIALVTVGFGIADPIVNKGEKPLVWARLACVIVLLGTYLYAALVRTPQWAHRFFVRPVLILALVVVIVVSCANIFQDVMRGQQNFYYNDFPKRWQCLNDMTWCYAYWGSVLSSLLLVVVVILEVLLTLSTGGKSLAHKNSHHNGHPGQVVNENPTAHASRTDIAGALPPRLQSHLDAQNSIAAVDGVSSSLPSTPAAMPTVANGASEMTETAVSTIAGEIISHIPVQQPTMSSSPTPVVYSAAEQ
ncbi:hypothetical protein BGZ83_002388, partial [Gryganskiella cystojenkinii]